MDGWIRVLSFVFVFLLALIISHQVKYNVRQARISCDAMPYVFQAFGILNTSTC